MVDGTMGSHRKEGSGKMNHSTIETAGIDTGKAWLDVALASATSRLRVSNDADGHEDLAVWLKHQGVGRVAIEASGGYERAVVALLRRRGFEVAVLQPMQVRSFKAFHLRRAKNDMLDAALIAACGAALESLRPPPDERLQALAEHLTFIEQIEADIVRAKTRREGFRDPRLRRLLEEEIRGLKGVRARELKALRHALQAHPDLARRLALLLSIPGIGERTALALLVRMPELGRLTREEAAALAGLAPYDDDSGKRRGPRRIAGGRTRLRTSLYAAALPAAFRWNPALIDLYKRLTAAGKPHKLALVACARKLLVFANTVLHRQTQWRTV